MRISDWSSDVCSSDLGTAIVTHVATGLVGTMAYWRSGQLGDRATRRIAMILCAATLVGIPVGIVINTRLSHDGFGLLLGIFAAAIGLLVCYRQRQRVEIGRASCRERGWQYVSNSWVAV